MVKIGGALPAESVDVPAAKPIEVGDMILIEYMDHVTIKGAHTQCDTPPILITIGIVEVVKPTHVILKSMWSATTGETKTRQLVVKSCITSIKRLVTSDKENWG
jgi:hypothetical protein